MKIMLRLALRGAALAVSVADCTVGPQFVRPESPQQRATAQHRSQP
jgi:hypothetical protein